MNIIYGEIKSQYEALQQSERLLEGLREPLAPLLLSAKGLVFVGSGSSFHVASSAAMMARLWLNCPALSLPAGDLLLHMSSYRPALEGATVVVLSRSGETSEAVLAIRKMREMGIRFSLVTFTCVAGSTLSGLSDLTVELPFAFDESVCQTRTVTCLYHACLYALATAGGLASILTAARDVLREGPAYLNAIEPALREIARTHWARAVVLGDAEIGGLCEEGALAFKEICQLPSNCYHLLDVRHGPMVLIDKKTLVIAALSSADPLERDLIRDIKARGATVVAYSDQTIDWPGVHCVSFGKPLPHAVRGIPFIAICQLIAYYKSFETGANPDQPDGLSAWIAL